jgi:mannosyltransferase OCH1-like enzyme
MIPKIIHQIWLGEDELSIVRKKAMQTVRSMNPDFKYILWTAEDLPEFNLENIIEESLHAAFAADIFRLKILEKFGGIYIDTDTICHKNLTYLLKKYDYPVSSIYINNLFPDVGVILAQENQDFSLVLADYLPVEPIAFYWQRMKPTMISEEEVGLDGEYLQDLRLNSWIEPYKKTSLK